MAFLGVDIGTSSVKAVVVGEDGDVLARTSVAYATSYRDGGAAEQDPESWIGALADGLRAVPARILKGVTAMAVDGHVPSVVLVDGGGRPVRPALIWQDTRARDEAARLSARLGDVSAEVGTTLPWAAAQLLPQLAWLGNHDEDAPRARAALSPKDYLNLQLTGVLATDPWTAKGMCDVRTGAPLPRLLEAAGWGASLCPPGRAPWDPLGSLTGDAADRLGLPAGVIVATGWTDALAAILAVGAFESPRGFVLTGTSNVIGVSTRHGAEAPGLYSVPQGLSAPTPLLYGPTQSGGETLIWWARLLGVDVAELVRLAGDAGGLELPTIVPYLRGERTPLWDADLRGVVTGLGIDDDRPRVARGVLSGVALSARHVLETAATATGDDLDGIDIGGQGVAAEGWRSIWLTTLGRPARLHAEPALSALGAAMVAALASGWPLDAIGTLRAAPTLIEPDARSRSVADQAYDRYLRASGMAMDWSAHERTVIG